MSELPQLTAANYLSKRLDSVSDLNPLKKSAGNLDNNQISSSNNVPDLTISAFDTSYLLLKDTVDKYSTITSVVQVSKNSLSTMRS